MEEEKTVGNLETEGLESENLETEGLKPEISEMDIEAKEKPVIKKNYVNLLKVWWFDLLFAIVIALIVLSVILIIPSNRYRLNFNRAEKYYVNEKYERAAAKYAKAVDIMPDSIDAYIGEILSLMNFEKDEEVYINIFLKSFEYEFDLENKQSYIDFYLLAPETVVKDKEALLNILEKAYERLDNTNSLNAALADAYFGAGLNSEDKAFDKALKLFDKCLEFSNNATEYSQHISETATEYIDLLITKEDFESAFSFAEKYKELSGFEYESITEKITAAKALYDTKTEVLSAVCDILRPYVLENKENLTEEYFNALTTPVAGLLTFDLSAMLMLDGSERSDMLAHSLTSGFYSYEDKENEGFFSALYPYGEVVKDEWENASVSYYFYYGEMKEEKRSGYGITFARTDTSSYTAFEGTWINDSPKGFGVSYQSNNYAHTSLAEYRQITFGNFSDGYEDGEMVSMAILNEHPDTYFTGTYTADMGAVKALEGSPEDYGILSPTKEGTSLVAILQSVTDGYDYFMPVYLNNGAVFSALYYKN